MSIPERAFAYRLGNRSALDWIVDQYRVKTDKRSGIKHDPNGYSDDPAIYPQTHRARHHRELAHCRHR